MMLIMKIVLNENELEHHSIINMIESNGYALVEVLRSNMDIRYKYIHSIDTSSRITVGNETVTFYEYDGNKAINHKTFKVKNLTFIINYLKNVRDD